MNNRRLVFLGGLTGLVIFLGLIGIYETWDSSRNQPRMRNHVAVVSDALWNLDPAGTREYLALACKHGNDEWIMITDEKGKEFIRVEGPAPSGIDRFFLSLGLIRLNLLHEPIVRNGQTIGQLTALHRHQTVYFHLYSLALLGLLYLAYLLFLRIAASKQILVNTVAERTSELVAANVKLQHEKGFSEDVIEGLPGMFFLFDELGHLVNWNRAAQTVTGYSAEDLSRMRPRDFFHQADQAMISQGVEEALHQGRSQLEANLVTRSGDSIPFYFISIRSELDGRAHIMCEGIDISERKQAEAEAARLKDQLHQSQKLEAIGQLAGGVAHDFNNLLAAIMGNAELLQLDLSPGTSEFKCSEEILLASSRASDLTKQLLSFSRKGKLQTINLDLHSIIGEVVALLGHSLDKRIEVVQNLEASFPHVSGDPTQLQSAILNLAVNGRDAMPDGGTLTLATRNLVLNEIHRDKHFEDLPCGHYLELAVSDTGVGMDEELQKRAFEPFFTTKAQGSGTGLGLASVYGCVIDHLGAVQIYSEPGHGTAFKVLLPLSPESPVPAILPAPIRGQGHILVVDDEESVRHFTRSALLHLGYTVSCCGDGKEAVDFFRQNQGEIDLVILDLIMPNLSGEEAFFQLREIDPQVRVLIASGFSRGGSADSLIQAGALGFLNKPFRIGELAREMALHLTCPD